MDVWKKDVWEFQARSGSSGSCRLFLHFLGKIAVRKMSGRAPGSPRHPSCRYRLPSDLLLSLRKAKPGGFPNPGVSPFFWERSRLCRGPFRDCSSQVLLIGRERGKGLIGKIPGPSLSKSGKSQKNRERRKKDKKGQKRTKKDKKGQKRKDKSRSGSPPV